jgi:AraC-like DNA-binding protein
MACVSCKLFVQDSLDELGIETIKVELGFFETKNDVTDEDKKQLNSMFKEAGLELLEKKQGVLIEKIRQVAIDYVYHSDGQPNHRFSLLLSKELDYSYTYLANFFSEVEAITIEQFIISLKIERIKELIIFGEDTFAEIANKLNYSSSQHLSMQFKKITGLTPTQFKSLKQKRRTTIQKM